MQELTSERRVTIQDGAAKTSQIAMAFLNVPAGHPDWYAINILADILGQGPQSRMQIALVGAKLATAFGEGESESVCGSSLLRMRARLADGVSVGEVEQVIDRELDRLARELVSEDELRLAHQQERQFADGQLSSPESIANSAGRGTLFYGDPEALRNDVRKMMAVTANDVRRVARKYLRRSNRVVVISKPR
jgi:predicted Zn-dependent peptidase